MWCGTLCWSATGWEVGCESSCSWIAGPCHCPCISGVVAWPACGCGCAAAWGLPEERLPKGLRLYWTRIPPRLLDCSCAPCRLVCTVLAATTSRNSTKQLTCAGGGWGWEAVCKWAVGRKAVAGGQLARLHICLLVVGRVASEEAALSMCLCINYTAAFLHACVHMLSDCLYVCDCACCVQTRYECRWVQVC